MFVGTGCQGVSGSDPSLRRMMLSLAEQPLGIAASDQEGQNHTIPV